jgi:lipoprotein-releasing system permease protein
MLVMALAVAVAAVNVASALSMLVVERRQDIAILKATGASPALIGSVFITAGLLAGGIGTVIGIAAGLLLSWKINELIGIAETLVNAVSQFFAAPGAAKIHLLDPEFYLSSIPVQIQPVSMLLIALLALVLCVLASFVPARKASRLSPLEITRKI